MIMEAYATVNVQVFNISQYSLLFLPPKVILQTERNLGHINF